MKNKTLLRLWAASFILCAFLGFIREGLPTLGGFLTFLSVLFFLPPGVLLYRARKTGDDYLRRLLRNLAAGSLGLTLVLLVLNFLSVLAGPTLGNILHWILTIVSTPMICGGHWAMSLFLWACLLIASLSNAQKPSPQGEGGSPQGLTDEV